MNIRLLAAYPSLKLMESVSPPVSPSVVAAIFTIQNPKTTSGTFIAREFSSTITDHPCVTAVLKP
jgi:hypothetical protein